MRFLLLCCCLVCFKTSRVSAVGKNTVYYFAAVDQTGSVSIDPQKKLASLITSNPKVRFVRFTLNITSMRTDTLNNVLFDRRYKTLTFHSVERLNNSSPKYYYRFYRIDGSRLQRWIVNQPGNTYSRDMNLFFLAEVGSPVKNIRTGKIAYSLDALPYK